MVNAAVITGAASGIGRACVVRLLAGGWKVWALDRNHDGLASLSETDRRLHPLDCDISDPQSASAAFAHISQGMDDVRALVHCAGVIRKGKLSEMTVEEIDLMSSVNIRGTWLTVTTAVPLLKRTGSLADPSRVVVVGSVGGIRPRLGNGFYSASKTAQHVLASVFAAELGPFGITVNVVAPGRVDTPMIRVPGPGNDLVLPPVITPNPLGRIGQPNDIVDVVEFLLGDGARYVNGAVLPVDGGERAAF